MILSAMHSYFAIRNFHRFIQYRQSLESRCPHCQQELGIVAAAAAGGVALPTSPDEATPRQSISANSVGEAEGDMLILKS